LFAYFNFGLGIYKIGEKHNLSIVFIITDGLDAKNN
jgi:hypothetical protein